MTRLQQSLIDRFDGPVRTQLFIVMMCGNIEAKDGALEPALAEAREMAIKSALERTEVVSLEYWGFDA